MCYINNKGGALQMSALLRPGTDVKISETGREGTVVKDLGRNQLEVCMCDTGEHEVHKKPELEVLEFTY
jgi:hypothetical protein